MLDSIDLEHKQHETAPLRGYCCRCSLALSHFPSMYHFIFIQSSLLLLRAMLISPQQLCWCLHSVNMIFYFRSWFGTPAQRRSTWATNPNGTRTLFWLRSSGQNWCGRPRGILHQVATIPGTFPISVNLSVNLWTDSLLIMLEFSLEALCELWCLCHLTQHSGPSNSVNLFLAAYIGWASFC